MMTKQSLRREFFQSLRMASDLRGSPDLLLAEAAEVVR